ncbi:TolC family protein [Cyclobacteriaceae bacterium]|nr:TolC family protein [Cyclobacteriaceae bacterium]
MKNISLLSSLLLFVGVTFGQTDTTTVFDLEQCIQYAFDHQQDVQNAELDVKTAQYQKKEAIGAGLPQVYATMQTVDNIALQQQYLPANAFNPAAPEDQIEAVGFGVDKTNNISMTASQLLFDGSYIAGVKASRVYVELFKKSKVQTKVDVVENISKAYFGVLVSGERVKILERDSETLEDLIDETRIRFQNGVVEEIDVQRLEVQLNNIYVQLENMRAFEEISFKVLKFQMGMEVDAPLTITGDLETLFKERAAQQLPGSDPKYRIEYQVLKASKQVDDINVSYNQGQGLPRLSVFGTVGYNTGANKTADLFNAGKYSDYAMVGLQLDVPIFQGFSKNSRVSQAKIASQKKSQDMAKFEMSVGLEVAQAKTNYEFSLKQIEFQQSNIELAENVKNTTEVKYREGVGTNYEVNAAVSDYLDAQANYFVAIYDAMIAHIELQKALGVLYSE